MLLGEHRESQQFLSGVRGFPERIGRSAALCALLAVAAVLPHQRVAVEREQPAHDAAQRLRLWRASRFFKIVFQKNFLM